MVFDVFPQLGAKNALVLLGCFTIFRRCEIVAVALHIFA